MLSSFSRKSHAKITTGAKKLDQSITDLKSFKELPTGARELKECIACFETTVQNMNKRFEKDLTGSLVTVQKPSKNLGNKDFDVEMCCVLYRGEIHKETVLPQCSEFLQAKENLKKKIEALEAIRKMIVASNQANKTMLGKLRDAKKTHTVERKVQPSSVEPEPFECLLEEHASPVHVHLEQIRDLSMQHHESLVRNLRKQFHSICLELQRDILTYQLVAEDTIGKLIHHAEKCRSYFAECHYLAHVERCFFDWWMSTQKDPKNDSSFYVSVVSETEGHRTRFSDFTVRQPFLYSTLPNAEAVSKSSLRIRITVRDASSNSVVFSELLDEELALKIFADDADVQPESYHRESECISSRPPATPPWSVCRAWA